MRSDQETADMLTAVVPRMQGFTAPDGYRPKLSTHSFADTGRFFIDLRAIPLNLTGCEIAYKIKRCGVDLLALRGLAVEDCIDKVRRVAHELEKLPWERMPVEQLAERGESCWNN